MHPIIGARDAAQLAENLGALDVVLPDQAVARMEAATGFEPGFPGDFIARCDEPGTGVYGSAEVY